MPRLTSESSFSVAFLWNKSLAHPLYWMMQLLFYSWLVLGNIASQEKHWEVEKWQVCSLRVASAFLMDCPDIWSCTAFLCTTAQFLGLLFLLLAWLTLLHLNRFFTEMKGIIERSESIGEKISECRCASASAAAVSWRQEKHLWGKAQTPYICEGSCPLIRWPPGKQAPCNFHVATEKLCEISDLEIGVVWAFFIVSKGR